LKHKIDAELISSFEQSAAVITSTTGFKPTREGISGAESFFRNEAASIAALSDDSLKQLTLSLGAFLAQGLINEMGAIWVKHKGHFAIRIHSYFVFPFSKAKKFLTDKDQTESLTSFFELPEHQEEEHSE